MESIATFQSMDCRKVKNPMYVFGGTCVSAREEEGEEVAHKFAGSIRVGKKTRKLINHVTIGFQQWRMPGDFCKQPT